VLKRLVEKGDVVTKRAYADWNAWGEYKRPLHEHAIELLEMPGSKLTGKNSADIKMVVDALELSYTKPHIDAFALISGDSDFSPLVSKLRENNKHTIGIGVKRSTSPLLVETATSSSTTTTWWPSAAGATWPASTTSTSASARPSSSCSARRAPCSARTASSTARWSRTR